MPPHSTFLEWVAKDPAFADQYARAREANVEVHVDEIIDIADDKSSDTITDAEGNERPNTEWIQRSRLRVDARKWVASKQLPKKYGDKLDVNHAGGVSIVVDTGVPKKAKE